MYHFLLECPKLEEARHDNLYNIENKYKKFKSLANVSKFIQLMSAEDTFIYIWGTGYWCMNTTITRMTG